MSCFITYDATIRPRLLDIVFWTVLPKFGHFSKDKGACQTLQPAFTRQFSTSTSSFQVDPASTSTLRRFHVEANFNRIQHPPRRTLTIILPPPVPYWSQKLKQPQAPPVCMGMGIVVEGWNLGVPPGGLKDQLYD